MNDLIMQRLLCTCNAQMCNCMDRRKHFAEAAANLKYARMHFENASIPSSGSCIVAIEGGLGAVTLAEC